MRKKPDLLSHWASIWQMNLSTTKCVVLRCSRSPTPIQYIAIDLMNMYILAIREHIWALYYIASYINHYLGPATYQKFPQ